MTMDAVAKLNQIPAQRGSRQLLSSAGDNPLGHHASIHGGNQPPLDSLWRQRLG